MGWLYPVFAGKDEDETMSIVFLPQIPLMRSHSTGEFVPKFDLTAAKKYGTIQALVDSFEKPQNREEVLDNLHSGLSDFSDGDYVLAAGNPAILSWTVAVAAYYNDGFVNMLQWNSPKGEYDVVPAQLW